MFKIVKNVLNTSRDRIIKIKHKIPKDSLDGAGVGVVIGGGSVMSGSENKENQPKLNKKIYLERLKLKNETQTKSFK